MMRRNKISLSSLVLLLFPVALIAQEFSAETVAFDPAGKPLSGKLYVGHGKVRADSSEGTIMLMDLGAKTARVYDPRYKVYLERPDRMTSLMLSANDPCQKDPDRKSAVESTCRVVGQETVNGRTTNKTEVTMTSGGQTQTLHIWFDPKLHILVRYEMNGKIMSELRNIQEGPQPASLFEPPAGYRNGLPGR
jgi:hypothetical protein